MIGIYVDHDTHAQIKKEADIRGLTITKYLVGLHQQEYTQNDVTNLENRLTHIEELLLQLIKQPQQTPETTSLPPTNASEVPTNEFYDTFFDSIDERSVGPARLLLNILLAHNRSLTIPELQNELGARPDRPLQTLLAAGIAKKDKSVRPLQIELNHYWRP